MGTADGAEATCKIQKIGLDSKCKMADGTAMDICVNDKKKYCDTMTASAAVKGLVTCADDKACVAYAAQTAAEMTAAADALKKPCCSIIKSEFAMCTGTKSATIDLMAKTAKMAGSCADTDCVGGSGSSLRSTLLLPAIAGLFALVATVF